MTSFFRPSSCSCGHLRNSAHSLQPVISISHPKRPDQRVEREAQIAEIADRPQGQDDERTRPNRRLVLTALGEAIEIPEAEREAAACAHLARHPDLDEFVRSPDCALVRVAISRYEFAGGIDDVQWYLVQESAAAN